jgi:hypothetical protein
MIIYSSARLQLLSNVGAIRKASRHANREDESSKRRRRADADPAMNLHHLPWSPGFTDGAEYAPSAETVDYVRDFRRMCESRGLKSALGAAPVAHLELIVSGAWVKEAGNLHDPANPRNLALFGAAVDFCEKVFGPKSVLIARADMDEKGGGVIDVLAAPENHSKRVGRYLSTRPALMTLQKRYGRKSAFSALQDAWAEFVQERLDSSIQRGRDKTGRGPDWVTPEVYAAKAELAKANSLLAAERAAFDAERVDLAAAQQILAGERRALEAERVAQTSTMAHFGAEREAISREWKAIEVERADLARERVREVTATERAIVAAALMDAKSAAMQALVSAVSEGLVVDIDVASGTVGFATKDAHLRRNIIQAVRTAPRPIVTMLGATMRFAAAEEDKARARIAGELAQLRIAATEEGFRTGYQNGVQRASLLPKLLQKALDAFLDGKLAVDAGESPRVVPTCPQTADLAVAVQNLGLNAVFARISVIMETLGTHQQAALRDIEAMKLH